MRAHRSQLVLTVRMYAHIENLLTAVVLSMQLYTGQNATYHTCPRIGRNEGPALLVLRLVYCLHSRNWLFFRLARLPGAAGRASFEMQAVQREEQQRRPVAQ
jgi:hypothetical protein